MTPDLSAFGAFHAPQPLLGGNRNAVWRVLDADGAHWVAKSCAHSQDALNWLPPVQAAARAAGFQVPHMRRSVNGQFAAMGWMMEPYVEGRPATHNDLLALSPRIKAFHQALPQLTQRPNAAGCRELLTIDQAAGIDLTLLPPDLRIALRDAWQGITDRPTHAIHGDICAGNVIITADGPCLIDWDEARCDAGFLDFAGIGPLPAPEARAHRAWEIACSWRREPAYAQRLSDGFI